MQVFKSKLLLLLTTLALILAFGVTTSTALYVQYVDVQCIKTTKSPQIKVVLGFY